MLDYYEFSEYLEQMNVGIINIKIRSSEETWGFFSNHLNSWKVETKLEVSI